METRLGLLALCKPLLSTHGTRVRALDVRVEAICPKDVAAGGEIDLDEAFVRIGAVFATYGTVELGGTCPGGDVVDVVLYEVGEGSEGYDLQVWRDVVVGEGDLDAEF